ncbi:VanZ family protein [Kitasatospora misakiensis]|uniref:VanZ family protein n=1 Tax=Kitasatospora misakiensis TaxID=67330 RepID=A0ABW0WX72_9ACTN
MRTETGRATAVQRYRRPLRAVGLLGLALHLLLVGWLVLRPLPVAWVDDANLTPLASLRSSTPGQLLGELLMLAPLGVLLPLAGGRLGSPWFASFLRTTGASALLATGLEFVSSWTPWHVLNVDHILLGVVGVAVVHLALVPVGRSLLLRGATAPRVPNAPASLPLPAPAPAARPAATPATPATPAKAAPSKAVEPLLSLGSPGTARRG